MFIAQPLLPNWIGCFWSLCLQKKLKPKTQNQLSNSSLTLRYARNSIHEFNCEHLINKEAFLILQPAQLVEKIRQFRQQEEETEAKQKVLNDSHVKITEVEVLRASVKDRHKTSDFLSELDTSVTRMEEYVRSLELENQQRAALVALLQQGDLFYEAQRGEFKVVCLV